MQHNIYVIEILEKYYVHTHENTHTQTHTHTHTLFAFIFRYGIYALIASDNKNS